MHFSVAKRHKIEKYSLILHSELKLLEKSQPMEKVCANRKQDGNNLCLLTPLYLFSFLALRGSYGFIGLILYYLSISLTYSCIVTSWSLGQSISLRARISRQLVSRTILLILHECRECACVPDPTPRFCFHR